MRSHEGSGLVLALLSAVLVLTGGAAPGPLGEGVALLEAKGAIPAVLANSTSGDGADATLVADTHFQEDAEKDFIATGGKMNITHIGEKYEKQKKALQIRHAKQREGYKAVNVYLEQLPKIPISGSGSDVGKSAASDPIIVDATAKLKAQHDGMETARHNILHAREMQRLLWQDFRGLRTSLPATAGRMEKTEIKVQSDQITEAIKHEKKAEALWKAKHGSYEQQAARAEKALQKAQLEYVKRDAEARAGYLKKVAKEQVDFDYWRAEHVGGDRQAFQRWKQSNMTNQLIGEQAARVEHIRSQIEAKLEKQMKEEFTAVHHQVDLREKEAGGIESSIEALAGGNEFKEQDRTDVAEDRERRVTREYTKQFSDDTKNALAIEAQAHHIDEAPRVQLETPEQKQTRIEALYLNGVLTPQGAAGDVIIDSLKNHKRLMAPIVYDGQTETNMMMNQTATRGAREAAQKEMDLLRQAIAAKRAEEKTVKKNMAAETDAVAERLRDNQASMSVTIGLRESLYERRAKYHALQEIKTLTSKLKSLGGFSSAREMAEEMKAKREMKVISDKVEIAKSELTREEIKTQSAFDHAHHLMKQDEDEDDVLPLKP